MTTSECSASVLTRIADTSGAKAADGAPASTLDWASLMEGEHNALANIEAQEDATPSKQAPAVDKRAERAQSDVRQQQQPKRQTNFDDSLVGHDPPFECELRNVPFSMTADGIYEWFGVELQLKPVNVHYDEGNAFVTLATRNDLVKLLGFDNLVRSDSYFSSPCSSCPRRMGLRGRCV